ncbi:MAG: YbaB/EbfC family nucleoid-associated protein [Lachnospiraceae bacterium]|nr:YbaB/EbfC family nucleoid-associated protein [Lachnospiraceae bacterium]MBQ9278738.1 YbaB/EbfC family nucleoid-associated protein [Lachnospiraceae bacterium]
MAKRGGFPGGMMPGNMNNLMKQAQKMQKQMEETTKELEEKEYEATAGGGVVKVKINGKKEITEIKIDKDAFDRDDEDLFEDIEENVMAAVNEAIRLQADDEKEKMGKITGGMGGGFPF